MEGISKIVRPGGHTRAINSGPIHTDLHSLNVEKQGYTKIVEIVGIAVGSENLFKQLDLVSKNKNPVNYKWGSEIYI